MIYFFTNWEILHFFIVRFASDSYDWWGHLYSIHLGSFYYISFQNKNNSNKKLIFIAGKRFENLIFKVVWKLNYFKKVNKLFMFNLYTLFAIQLCTEFAIQLLIKLTPSPEGWIWPKRVVLQLSNIRRPA